MPPTFEDKLYWAKKGAQFNLNTPDDDVIFRDLVKRSRMTKDSFVYYTNAYEAAGESGIKALTYKGKMPDEVRDGALEQINRFFHERSLQIPEQHRGEIGYLVKAKGSVITASEKRPIFNDPSRTSCSDIFQARYTDYDGRWHLYWHRASGKWWPYTPKEPIYKIEDCLREVKNDPLHCFWG
jgi:hypothetical protein